MRPAEIRSHRLNYLLKFYLKNPNSTTLYIRAKQMGVTNKTAHDYADTVINMVKSKK